MSTPDISKRPKRRAGEGTLRRYTRGGWEARAPHHLGGKSFYASTPEEALSRMRSAITGTESVDCDRETIVEETLTTTSVHERTHVYFLQGITGGPIKIGVARNPEQRLRSIQGCSPVPLQILHVIENGGSKLESELHERFGYCRLHGEWFEDVPALVKWISRAKERNKE